MKFIHILATGAVAALIGCCTLAVAGGDQSVITGYFESGAVPGKFVYEDSVDGRGLRIEYYSPSLKKTLVYNVAKFDECSAMAMYQIYGTHQVVVDGSCVSRGGQIYKYVYEWREARKNWCLVREITGEKADISSRRVASTEQVARVKNCPFLGATGPYSYESTTEVARDIALELREFRDSENSREALRKYLDSTPMYSISELVNYIDVDNVRDINNLAFYLSENGRPADAIPLLEKIVEKFPKRVVAKLNLADAYWDNDLKDRGSLFCKKYYDEMLSGNLGEKIPGRVFNRMKKCENLCSLRNN